MDRKTFLERLQKLLSDLSDEEQEEALAYYRDYFEEAGLTDGQEVPAYIGSPEKAAAEIRAGLAGDEEAGEFTERGYRDERFEDAGDIPDQYAEIAEPRGQGREEKEQKGRAVRNAKDCRQRNGRGTVLFLILFLVFGVPLGSTIISAGFSVIAAIFGAVLGIFGGLFGLAAGGIAGAVGLFAAGCGLIATGACNMVSPAIGLMLIGLGFFAIAAGVLCLMFVRWCFGAAIPCVFRLSGSLIRTVCDVIGRLWRRIFGGGGRR